MGIADIIGSFGGHQNEPALSTILNSFGGHQPSGITPPPSGWNDALTWDDNNIWSDAA